MVLCYQINKQTKSIKAYFQDNCWGSHDNHSLNACRVCNTITLAGQITTGHPGLLDRREISHSHKTGNHANTCLLTPLPTNIEGRGSPQTLIAIPLRKNTTLPSMVSTHSQNFTHNLSSRPSQVLAIIIKAFQVCFVESVADDLDVHFVQVLLADALPKEISCMGKEMGNLGLCSTQLFLATHKILGWYHHSLYIEAYFRPKDYHSPRPLNIASICMNEPLSMTCMCTLDLRIVINYFFLKRICKPWKQFF